MGYSVKSHGFDEEGQAHGEKIGIRPCVTLLLWSCGGCIAHLGKRERLNGQYRKPIMKYLSTGPLCFLTIFLACFILSLLCFLESCKYTGSHGNHEGRVALFSVSLQVSRIQVLLVVAVFSPFFCLSFARINELTLLKALAKCYIVLHRLIMGMFLLLLLERGTGADFLTPVPRSGISSNGCMNRA